jgi:hypothetical protein
MCVSAGTPLKLPSPLGAGPARGDVANQDGNGVADGDDRAREVFHGSNAGAAPHQVLGVRGLDETPAGARVRPLGGGDHLFEREIVVPELRGIDEHLELTGLASDENHVCDSGNGEDGQTTIGGSQLHGEVVLLVSDGGSPVEDRA